jgi:hypothetical protein
MLRKHRHQNLPPWGLELRLLGIHHQHNPNVPGSVPKDERQIIDIYIYTYIYIYIKN